MWNTNWCSILKLFYHSNHRNFSYNIKFTKHKFKRKKINNNNNNYPTSSFTIGANVDTSKYQRKMKLKNLVEQIRWSSPEHVNKCNFNTSFMFCTVAYTQTHTHSHTSNIKQISINTILHFATLQKLYVNWTLKCKPKLPLLAHSTSRF